MTGDHVMQAFFVTEPKSAVPVDRLTVIARR